MTTPKTVTWDAEEYLIKSHNTWWYVGLIVVTLGLSALAVWLQGWTFLALIIISAITILIMNLRPPRKIHYELNSKGLTENNLFHPYENFRAFGILQENDHFSAILIPKKRFGLSVKVYFPSTSGEAIVDLLGGHLPMEAVKPDILDKIVNFLRI